ncbi:hypothetical protein Bealeia1_00011 [Candidatus Bealeia paramacronuclearis]|uniref:Uncharacterized protein n=1 Tax=Candidatus Bealeia paramacronuclearis TaxID=1921001 RepID=A0ABZ2C0E6_9PROT|nr:hypothetical protein [Candidatus Bealeia paramacronuclearis]
MRNLIFSLTILTSGGSSFSADAMFGNGKSWLWESTDGIPTQHVPMKTFNTQTRFHPSSLPNQPIFPEKLLDPMITNSPPKPIFQKSSSIDIQSAKKTKSKNKTEFEENEITKNNKQDNKQDFEEDDLLFTLDDDDKILPQEVNSEKPRFDFNSDSDEEEKSISSEDQDTLNQKFSKMFTNTPPSFKPENNPYRKKVNPWGEY